MQYSYPIIKILFILLYKYSRKPDISQLQLMDYYTYMDYLYRKICMKRMHISRTKILVTKVSKQLLAKGRTHERPWVLILKWKFSSQNSDMVMCDHTVARVSEDVMYYWHASVCIQSYLQLMLLHPHTLSDKVSQYGISPTVQHTHPLY